MKLPTDAQISRILDLFEKRGFEMGSVTIGSEGISVWGKGERNGSANEPKKSLYDQWLDDEVKRKREVDKEWADLD